MSRALRKRYGRAAKRAFHYVARIKGPTPTRFFVGPGEMISAAAAHAFAGWAKASDMVLWPSDSPGKYTAKWYDKFSETFRETPLTVLEEADPTRGHARADVMTMRAVDPQAHRKTREGTSVTRHATVPGIYPGLAEEMRTREFEAPPTERFDARKTWRSG